MTILKAIGHLMCVCLLVTGACCVRVLDWTTRTFVGLIQTLTGATVERDQKKLHPQRELINELVYEDNKPEVGVLNENTMLKNSSFSLSPEQLIIKAKKLLSPEAEFGSKNPDLLAEDFQFIFPIVGPLCKTEFCTIFGSFKLKDAFPDSRGNFFGFTVDPMEPNRVWFFSRGTATHTGPLKFGKKEFPPTGKEVVNTPQVLSMCFDEEGRCYKFTGGYSIDRTIGNCGGLGGVFGVIHSLGGSLPFPEAKPWKPSLEWEALAKRLPEAWYEWTGHRNF